MNWVDTFLQLGLGGGALAAMVLMARWFLNALENTRRDFLEALERERDAFLAKLNEMSAATQRNQELLYDMRTLLLRNGRNGRKE